ncbi:MAG: hypothetical protein P8Y61_07955 [Gammaproteobacteria bacterium]
MQIRQISNALLITASLFLLQPSVALTANTNSFQKVEIETLDEEDFIFPDDLRAKSLNIVLLAISKEQDNGQWQGDRLIEWYAALDEKGVLSDDVLGYHFSVMKVPFFVKGLIRGGLADSYEGKVPPDQAGAIFVKDIAAFASSAGIALDGQPTIVLVSANGELLQIFKGEVSEPATQAVASAVASYTAKNSPDSGSVGLEGSAD